MIFSPVMDIPRGDRAVKATARDPVVAWMMYGGPDRVNQLLRFKGGS
jgi:hypothetical protein